jgi:hypothetical protein
MKHSHSYLEQNLIHEETKHEELDELPQRYISQDFEDIASYGSYLETVEISFKAPQYEYDFENPSSSDCVNYTKLYNIPAACPICSLDIDSKEIFRIPECNHIFCTSCVRQYLETRINDSQVLTMPCPDYNCVNMIPDNYIAKVLNDEILQKYTRFKREAELTKRNNLRWCPMPDCEGYDLGGTKKKKLKCNVCSTHYCYYCGDIWKDNHSKCNAANDFELDAWSKKHEVKHCPNCRRRVEKVEGCNHMTCSKCRYEWCWLCGARYHPNHFSECEVLKITRRNVAWKYIGLFLVGPIAGLLLFVIGGSGLAYEVYREKINNQGFRKFIELFLIYLLLVPLAFAISPLGFLVLFVISGPSAINEIIQSNVLGLDIRSNCCRWFMKYIIGTCISPIVSAIAVVVVMLSPIAGVFLILYKLYIYLRRCCNRDYLNPNRYGDY